MRYSSFALVSGQWAAALLPAFVAFTNYSSMTAKQIDSQKERYGDEFVEVRISAEENSQARSLLSYENELVGIRCMEISNCGNTCLDIFNFKPIREALTRFTPLWLFPLTSLDSIHQKHIISRTMFLFS